MAKFFPRFKERAKKLNGDKPLYRRYSFWLGLGVGSGMIAFARAWWFVERSLPDTAELLTFVRNETLTIKAADGTLPYNGGK